MADKTMLHRDGHPSASCSMVTIRKGGRQFRKGLSAAGDLLCLSAGERLNMEKGSNKIFLYTGLVILGLVILGSIVDDGSPSSRINKQKTEVVESNAPENPLLAENSTENAVIKIEDKEQIAEAIRAVDKTITAYEMERIALLLEPTDVYQNPKGGGVIVWRGGTFVYLINNNAVYAISGDAGLLSPEVPKAEKLSIHDLEEIKKARASDFPGLLRACLKRVEQASPLEARIMEEQNNCYSKYPIK